MKLPLSWLKEYVDIKETAEKLAEDLLLSGTKIETVEKDNSDFILDFEITPNRPDTLSAIGVARELAAIYQRKITLPQVFNQTAPSPKEEIKIKVAEETLCPRYTVGLIDKVTVGTSPKWLSERLEKAGIRSINNIVDITNFVMVETGQPLHAFDANKIKGRLVLRSSKEGETLTTLDSIERKLPKGSIIIEDEEKLVDLCGIMGAENSEIDSNTKKIILHSPLYDPLSIRLTSQAIGVRTEASNRFEKLLDPNGHRFGFERALELIRQNAGGELISKIESVGYPVDKKTITVPLNQVHDLIGESLEKTKIVNILERLDFSVSESGDELEIGIPTFRTDIRQSVDLVEEIGRIYGYNNLAKILPQGPIPSIPETSDFETKIKNILSALHLQEVYTNTLTSALWLEGLGYRSKETLKVKNRLLTEYEYLRPSLLIGLLEAVKTNIENFDSFSLFEVGKIFEAKTGHDGLPIQPKKAAAVFVGSDFTTAKGSLEALVDKLYIKVSFKETESVSPFGLSYTQIYSGDKIIGVFGSLSRKIQDDLGVNSTLYFFELDFEAMESLSTTTSYKALPKFPVVKEDISMFISESLTYSQITEVIEKGAGENFYSARLIEDTKVGGNRSILIGVEYYSPTHTLEREEVVKIRRNVLTSLEAVGANIRE